MHNSTYDDKTTEQTVQIYDVINNYAQKIAYPRELNQNETI